MHLGGGASHSHITKKINENKKKYGKNEVSHLYFFVLKLPCLDVETDAKNPRQAGTVAKNPRGTDAKNPPQLAPLQKTPVTVWNVPTVAKNPYYRRKKPQPLLTHLREGNSLSDHCWARNHSLKRIDFFSLVVSTHLKNISQIGSFPQVGVRIKNIWNHHLVLLLKK